MLGLILVMIVALGIGLSVVQKSLVDVSTSSKVEDSSRAFSAAEAGIEKAFRNDTTPVNFAGNNSSAAVYDSGLYPIPPAPNNRQDSLEYPPLAKEEVAHFWLADPASNLPVCDAGKVCYTQPTLDIYWGDSSSDKAALELTLVYYSAGSYQSRKWFLDQISRIPSNGFDTTLPACNGGYSPAGSTSVFQCKVTIGQSPNSLPMGMMLIRARLLYNSTSQPIAIQAVGTCGQACSIPSQARILISTGASGETKRRVKVFKIDKVVPPYFDFAIFSAGDISK